MNKKIIIAGLLAVTLLVVGTYVNMAKAEEAVTTTDTSTTDTNILETTVATQNVESAVQSVAASVPVCSPTDPVWMNNDLHGTVSKDPLAHTGRVNNTSATCTYQVILAAYKKFDAVPRNQVFFSHQVKNVGPGETVDFSIDVPSCEYQLDLYSGRIVYDFNQRIESGLPLTDHTIDAFGGNFGNYCTNVQSATLKLVKTVVNEGGGTKTVSDFPLFQNGVSVTSGDAKTYTFSNASDSLLVTATETNQANYRASKWGGDCATDGKVTLHPGENKTCTITNTFTPNLACADGETLSLAETKTAIHDGKLTLTLSVDATTNKATSVIENKTGCAVPLSLSTYKMFDQTLDTQEFFDADPLATPKYYTIPKNGTKTLTANIPTCMAQADVWYGAYEQTLHNTPGNPTDPSPYPNALAAKIVRSTGTTYFDAAGAFCTHPRYTATLKLIKTVSNTHGGTKTPADFSLFMDSTKVNTGEEKTFYFTSSTDSKNIIVSEANLSGYEAGSWTGACSTSLLGDVNKDGHVNKADMDILSKAYNTKTGDAKFDVRADLNKDGNVDFSDLVVVAQNFGTNLGNSNVLADQGDANRDGVINDADGVLVSSAYNTKTGDAKFDAKADFDHDGFVNFNDLVIYAQHYSLYVPMSSVVLRPGDAKVCEITNSDLPTPTPTPTPGEFSLTCTANPTSANLNTEITWTAVPVGGTGSYTFSWEGTDTLTGNATSTKKTYTTIGTKIATTTVVSGNQTRIATCSVVISNPPVGCTGSCCAGGCGGGSTPSVVVTRSSGQVAGVFLSQVPYTGVDMMKVYYFMFGLLVWSAGVAYYFIRRKSAKETPFRFASVNGMQEMQEEQVAMRNSYDLKTAFVQKLESKARDMEALVSTSALEKIAETCGYNTHDSNIMLQNLVSDAKSHPDYYEGSWVTVNESKIV